MTCLQNSVQYPKQSMTFLYNSVQYPKQSVICLHNSVQYPKQALTCLQNSVQYPKLLMTCLKNSVQYPKQPMTCLQIQCNILNGRWPACKLSAVFWTLRYITALSSKTFSQLTQLSVKVSTILKVCYSLLVIFIIQHVLWNMSPFATLKGFCHEITISCRF